MQSLRKTVHPNILPLSAIYSQLSVNPGQNYSSLQNELFSVPYTMYTKAISLKLHSNP